MLLMFPLFYISIFAPTFALILCTTSNIFLSHFWVLIFVCPSLNGCISYLSFSVPTYVRVPMFCTYLCSSTNVLYLLMFEYQCSVPTFVRVPMLCTVPLFECLQCIPLPLGVRLFFYMHVPNHLCLLGMSFSAPTYIC